MKRIDKDAVLLATACALLLVALLMPAFRLPRATHDWIVVFDITQSMNVEDYEIDGARMSRLDYARESVRRALPALTCGSRVGWAAFAEYRTLLLMSPVEVCANYDDLLKSLDNIDGRMRWANASEVIKGVYWSLRVSRELGFSPRVLFVTDGQEAPPLDPAYRTPVFDDITIGETQGFIVGAGGLTPQPIPKTDDETNERVGYWRAAEVIQLVADPANPGATRIGEHLSALREPHLQALAQAVGLDYMRLDDPAVIRQALQSPKLARSKPVATNLSWLPALAALLLLAWRFRPDFPTFRRRQAAARAA